MLISGKDEKLNVCYRIKERRLLLYNIIYLFICVLFLCLGGHLEGIILLWVIILTFSVALLLIMINLIWGFTGYKADLYLLPIVTLINFTGLAFLLRLQPEYGLKQFV